MYLKKYTVENSWYKTKQFKWARVQKGILISLDYKYKGFVTESNHIWLSRFLN